MKWTFYIYGYHSLFLTGKNISFSFSQGDIFNTLSLHNIMAHVPLVKNFFYVKQIYYSPVDGHSALMFTLHKISDVCYFPTPTTNSLCVFSHPISSVI